MRYQFRTVVLGALLLFSHASLTDSAKRIDRDNLLLENIPPIPSTITENIRRRQESGSAGYLDWADNASDMLIWTRVKSVAQIHCISAPQGARQQLTFSLQSLNSAVAQPGGAGFVYTKDDNGDENYQLYFHDMKTGAELRVTDGKKSRNLGALWSKDGKQLAYLHSPEGTNRYQVRIARADAITTARTVLDRDGAFSIEDWSMDGNTLLLNRFVSMNESYMYTLSIKSGELRELNPQPATASRIAYNGGQYPQFLGGLTGGPPRGARFSSDSRTVYFVSDQDSEFARVRKIELATGKQTVITPDLQWDVEGFDLSPDGATLAYSINENGFSQLRIMNVSTRTALPAPSLPPGIIGNRGFDRQGKRLAFTFMSATKPASILVWDLPNESLTHWTDSSVTGISPAALVQPSLIQFRAFDKRTISAVSYRPNRQGKLPVIIVIHGGPEAQFRPSFSTNGPVVSGLELGFAIIAPNVRGSTGYGKTFVALDNGVRREDAVKDIGSLLDWIETQPHLDKARVVLYGASYGGYMVNASMVHFTGRLRAAVSIVAISDFYSFLKNTSEYRRDLRRAEYGDERNPEMAAFMKRIAPLAQAPHIAAPMLIVHGANDPRVPISEAEQLLAALKATGNKPWLMIAKDEGHGFQKQINIDRLDGAVELFLNQAVLGNAPHGTPTQTW
jgi:dipeptidyl aminopeptidase/acylaminoacyl peptidase